MNRHVSQGRKIRAHRVSPNRLTVPTRFDVHTVPAPTPNRARAEIDAIIRDSTSDELRSRRLGNIGQLVAALLCCSVLTWLLFASVHQLITHPMVASYTFAGFIRTLTPVLCLFGALVATIYAFLTITVIADLTRALRLTRRDMLRVEADR